MTELVERSAAGWVPAFDGQRPPFPEGNTVSLRHGAYSPRRIDELADSIREAVLADPSLQYLTAPRYAAAVWGWARAEAQVQRLTEWLAEQGEVGDLADESVKSAYLLLHRAEARALSGRRACGLDPLAASRLGRDKVAAAADVAGIFATLGKLEREGRLPEGASARAEGVAS